jgi:hypothetical protein
MMVNLFAAGGLGSSWLGVESDFQLDVTLVSSRFQLFWICPVIHWEATLLQN